MLKVIGVVTGLALASLSANAQAYRCEYGELVGGEAGVSAKCTVNSVGQITSVTPYKPSTRDKVKIYRGGDVKNVPVQTVTPLGKRAYQPAPLKPQQRPTAQHYAPTRRAELYSPPAEIVRPKAGISPNGNIYRTRHSNILTASPSPQIQRAAYASACNFKIREVKARGDINIYEVCYSDIQPSNRRSLKKLYSRIKRASRRACGTDYDSVLTRWSRSNARCVDDSMDRAILTSGIDPLRAYHLAKTGKGTPTVNVGKPRYFD